MSAARSKDTYLAAKFRRIASRRGPIKAIVALEHAMLVAIWHMITDGIPHSDPGGDYFTRLNPDKAKHRALHQLHMMGYSSTLEPLAVAGQQRIFASEWGSNIASSSGLRIANEMSLLTR